MSTGTADAQSLVDERIDQLLAGTPEREGPEFWGAMYDLGLAWVHFSEGLVASGSAPNTRRTLSPGSAAKAHRFRTTRSTCSGLVWVGRFSQHMARTSKKSDG